jgi:AraC-like DNA-binding protein/quercetin dioxygenase-like cupin family protein
VSVASSTEGHSDDDAEEKSGVINLGSEFLYASLHEEEQGWHLQAREHAHHELVIIRSGVLRVKLSGETHVARRGEVLFFPSNMAHEEWAEQETLSKLTIGLRWNGHRPGMPVCLADKKGRLAELAEWLFSERHARFQDAQGFRAQLVRALICEYMRLSEESGWEPATLDPENPMVRTVRTFIRENLAEHFTLDDLASQAKMSKFYFARAYRSLTGLSPMDHARLIRLEAARELLLKTNLPLKAIAPKVGFASEFHLSRLLRTRLGIGARQIRARQSAMS